MQNKRTDADDKHYGQNIFAPPGLHSFSMIESDQKQTLQEEDTHFLQYVDKCKSQINHTPKLKSQTKENKKIPFTNSNMKSNSPNQTAYENSIDHYSKNGNNHYENNMNSDKQFTGELQQQSTKDNINQNHSSQKKKFHSMHIEQLQQNKQNTLNLADKFLVAVISPQKVRQSQNRYTDSQFRDQQQVEFGGKNNTSQINELLNQQQQILLNELNKNHSQVINLSHSTQIQSDYLQNTLLNQQPSAKNNNTEDKSIFLNRLLALRSNQSSTTSHVYRSSKPYFESLKSQGKKLNTSDNLNGQENSNNNSSNNNINPQMNLSASHYSGKYSFYQNQLPTTKTLENLLSDDFNPIYGKPNDKNSKKKINMQKTEYELMKIQQTKEFENKYKSSMNKKYPEVSLLPLNQNEMSHNPEIELNQLSSSNIGFGQVKNSQEFNLNKQIKEHNEREKVQQQLQPQGLIYYNNLRQLSIQDNNINKRKLTHQQSVSPNGQSYYQINQTNSQENNLFSTQYPQKYRDFQNSIFDSLPKKDKSSTPVRQIETSHYHNRSIDFKTHLTRKLQLEKPEYQNPKYNLQNISNKSVDNALIFKETSTPYSQNKIFNQKNSLQRNFSPLPLQQTPIIQSTKSNFKAQISYQYPTQQISNTPLQPISMNNNINSDFQSDRLYNNQTPNKQDDQQKFTKKDFQEEDYQIKRKRQQMHCLKRSPQKGNSVKNKEKQNTTTPNRINNKYKDSLTKDPLIKKDQVDRISTICGVSPSLLRESLRHQDGVQNNLANSSQVLSEILNSLQVNKTIDKFQFHPNKLLNQEQSQGQTPVKYINNQTNVNVERFLTEGNQKNYNLQEDNQEDYQEPGTLTPDHKFLRYEEKQQNEAKQLKIKKLFTQTLQKKNFQNSSIPNQKFFKKNT